MNRRIRAIQSLGGMLVFCGGGGGGGGAACRLSLEAGIWNMVLDHWNGQGVQDPISYFRNEMGPGGVGNDVAKVANSSAVLTTEKVLEDTFCGNFEGTLNVIGFACIRDRVSRTIADTLNNSNSRLATCPGFRDMIMQLPADHQLKADLPSGADVADSTSTEADRLASKLFGGSGNGGNGGGGGGGRFADRNALAITLGSAFLDYFNGFPVGDDLSVCAPHEFLMR